MYLSNAGPPTAALVIGSELAITGQIDGSVDAPPMAEAILSVRGPDRSRAAGSSGPSQVDDGGDGLHLVADVVGERRDVPVEQARAEFTG